MRRKTILANEYVYHIYNKSIYGFIIFNNADEFERLRSMIYFYQWQHDLSFCKFLQSGGLNKSDLWSEISLINAGKSRLVEIVAYCLMPTHVHFILKQCSENGISLFIKKLLGGYTLYFNHRHNRRGPLWQSRFGSRLIENDRDLFVTCNYVHENPVKDLNLQLASDWSYSSYLEYQGKIDPNQRICNLRITGL
jgi:putative transposase